MTYVSEKYQFGIVAEYLDDNDMKWVTEPVLYSIPIDILAKNVESGELLSIELKTKDFRKGVRQANRNLAYVERSYLSMWADQISDSMIEESKYSDFGLISVDEEVKILSPARENTPDRYARSKAEEIIENDV